MDRVDLMGSDPFMTEVEAKIRPFFAEPTVSRGSDPIKSTAVSRRSSPNSTEDAIIRDGRNPMVPRCLHRGHPVQPPALQIRMILGLCIHVIHWNQGDKRPVTI